MREQDRKQLWEARKRQQRLQELYDAMCYLETMPERDPLYKYCYSTSSMSIPGAQHSVDAWLRAVIMHMSNRKFGHGGMGTNAVLVSVPSLKNDAEIERWLEYATDILRAKAQKIKKRGKR